MSGFDCAICLEAPVNGSCVTPCQHKFCTECFTRAMKFLPPWYSGTCPICRSSVSLFNTVDAKTRESLEALPVTSIWGQVYLQDGSIGIASYHFDSPTECYISYANAPSDWKLDDGSSPPKKKYFENASYDEKTKVFRGVIIWKPAKFNGEETWTYEMR